MAVAIFQKSHFSKNLTIIKANLVSDERCTEAYGPYQQKKICTENLDTKVECPNDRSTLLVCYDLKTFFCN